MINILVSTIRKQFLNDQIFIVLNFSQNL